MGKSTGKAGALRRRMNRSEGLARLLGRVLSAYLGLCWRSGRWRSEGEADLAAALADGPVVLICWHGRSMMTNTTWAGRAPLAMPRDPSPAGRVAAAALVNQGALPFEIDLKGGNFGAVRDMIRLVRGGASLALTGDGPKGPVHEAKQSTLDWARATGRPVFITAWAQARPWRLGTWDRLMVPKPLGRGAFVYHRWSDGLAKAGDEAARAQQRVELAALMTQVTERADELATGAKPAPKP